VGQLFFRPFASKPSNGVQRGNLDDSPTVFFRGRARSNREFRAPLEPASMHK
jgi:hypothetical protein